MNKNEMCARVYFRTYDAANVVENGKRYRTTGGMRISCSDVIAVFRIQLLSGFGFFTHANCILFSFLIIWIGQNVTDVELSGGCGISFQCIRSKVRKKINSHELGHRRGNTCPYNVDIILLLAIWRSGSTVARTTCHTL